MEANVLPSMNISAETMGCCPKFNPEGWGGRHLNFKDKRFVRATTRSVLHVPINMGSVFSRVQEHIEDAAVQDADSYLTLSRDLSSSESEHYLAVTGDVADEEMTTLSGDFITRVFERSYKHARDWMHAMKTAAEAAGYTAKQFFMFYTTCLTCAKAYGKNYVVDFAEI